MVTSSNIAYKSRTNKGGSLIPGQTYRKKDALSNELASIAILEINQALEDAKRCTVSRQVAPNGPSYYIVHSVLSLNSSPA
jgi:hypothetical protein